MKIVVVDYGAGNVYSVLSAIRRLGYQAVVSGEAAVIRSADRVIFPGVGQASAAMKKIQQRGIDKLLPQLKIPVLGICLGMQLMCIDTEEDKTSGLGIFPLSVKKFRDVEKVPHMGWNTIGGMQTALFKGVREGERMYFVHSYYLQAEEPEIVKAVTDYSTTIHASVEKDNVFACQFHPEKSSRYGLKILENFAKLEKEGN